MVKERPTFFHANIVTGMFNKNNVIPVEMVIGR